MKLSTDTFPFYDQCRSLFGVDIDTGTVFTYGDTIHARCGVPPDLYEHEQTHSIQQERMGKDLWWKTYLADEKFRMKQELEAYRKQYWFFCTQTRDRNRRAVFLHKIASDLSGTMYGNILTLQEAKTRIQA